MRRVWMLLALLPLISCSMMLQGEPIVWQEKSGSLKGYKQFQVLPVTNETGQTFDFDVTAQISQLITKRLQQAGFVTVQGKDGVNRDVVLIKSSLTSYKTGSAAGRWVGFGAGSAECIVRSTLVKSGSGSVLGEIISTKILDSGGLYTVGLDKRLHEQAAEEIAEAVIKLAKE